MKRFFLWIIVGGCLSLRLLQTYQLYGDCFLKNPAALSDSRWSLSIPKSSSRGHLSEFFRRRVLVRMLQTPHLAAFQLALWQGDLSGLPFWLLQKYRERGLLQVLALSGQHVWALTFCLSCLGGLLWKKWPTPRGRMFLLARKIKVPLAVGFLISLAPSEPSLIRTALCVVLVFIFKEIPLVIPRGYAMSIGLMFFLCLYPRFLFERGFQLSLIGILGVWVVGHCFSAKQKLRATLWLVVWFFSVMALFFGKWVGDSVGIQIGMGFIWDQILLPVLFLSGGLVLLLPQASASYLAVACEKCLNLWLNWEAMHLEMSGLSVLRPSLIESGFFLAWLIALALWNRNRCRNVPKNDAYGATCIDLTRSARGQ